MRVSQLSRAEADATAVKTLGLDHEAVDLLSPEALCASLRRAASFLCPASPRQIVDAVLDAVGPLDIMSSVTRDHLMELLDLLISTRDLLELRRPGERQTRQLYLGPPSYVVTAPGRYLLLGVRPYAAPLVGDTPRTDILHEGHTRIIRLDPGSAPAQLQATGLHEITREQWLNHPRAQAAADFLQELRQRLTDAGPAGQVEGLTLIDPSRSVRYYQGRWREPKANDHGDFVARRPQAYGADLWCFVRIEAGSPVALIDFPVADLSAPGRDEAWRAQAALDAERGQPQTLRTRTANGRENNVILDLFAPVPGWAERYLEMAGQPVTRSGGSLVSYRVPGAAIPALTEFLSAMLWMRVSEKEEGGTT
jgi:hypothetical protein